MAYTPFFQGTEAQKVIDSFLGSGVTASTPMQPMDMNAQGVFRNPYLPKDFYPDDSAIYPDPIYTPPVNDDENIPNCPPGYVYDEILKQCVYVGDSVQEETRFNDNDEVEERDYMSIKDMRNASNEDLLKYLKSGYLSNSLIGFLPSKGNLVTLKDSFPSLQGALLQSAFGNQSELRKKAMENELMRRGYFSGQYDDSGDFIFDVAGTPDNSYLFTPKATTDEANVPYGGTTSVGDSGGSYGGGEDFGGGGYQGNVVVNNQQIQQQNQQARDRYDAMFGKDAGI